MIRLTFLIAAILLLSTPALDAQQPGGGPPPAAVRTDVAVSRDMAPTIQSPATVLSRSDSRIAAEAAGRVVHVAEPGDWVEAGEPVARLDDRQARLQLAEARSRHARLSENARFQEEEFQRWTRLAEAGTAPQTRLREVELARNLAQQERSEAASAVQRAQLDLDRTEILAPFSGRVAERLIEVGEYSAPGANIVRLVDTNSLEARAQTPVAVAPYIAVGDMIHVSDGTTGMDAAIRAIVPVGDSVSRTFEIRVDLEDAPWIIGTAVRVSVPTETPRHVVAVPRDALVLRTQGSHVWVVAEDNTARQVQVRTGAQDGEYVAVEGEIGAGDRVVVRGAENLRPGQPLNILDDAETAGGGDGPSNVSPT
ncbi:efflux RND transporter periplasmic adaptor subunit [Hyphobacterium marinum]|uniref:Efflux RND transporter periplasmic adaptor subunit n=1 Tax=Hyphobacterium marinum TaxID=3116574 RepID=A0ABU7LZK6_9PROT|nr:efflux RND transporter periplasmic adaptor subunit [Hyphobacterium sp. Y6023]MEE2566620.1 efflux RND transporter periplasmic adaptor subunit [Hyphobacterium sp. Y6023]